MNKKIKLMDLAGSDLEFSEDKNHSLVIHLIGINIFKFLNVTDLCSAAYVCR